MQIAMTACTLIAGMGLFLLPDIAVSQTGTDLPAAQGGFGHD